MQISLTQLNTDFANAIAELPTSFTYAGVVYSGLLTDLTAGKDLVPGGFNLDYDAQLFAQTSGFSVVPTSGITVGIGSVVYRADKVTSSPDGVGTVMHLIATSK